MKMYFSDKVIQKLVLTIWLSVFSCVPNAYAAKEVALVSGAFSRSISISDIEHLAKTGEARGLLEDVIRISNQKPKKLAALLTQKLDLPLMLTSRLMNTTIGDVILGRIAKIIYPIKVKNKSVSIPAIRAGVIKAIQIENNRVSILDFLKAYPNKVVAVNLPGLTEVVKKVESITDLVKFFSNSPLDGLKKGNAKT